MEKTDRAREISITPTLKGKDAILFLRKMKENQNRKASKEELFTITDNAQKLKSILKNG